MSGSGLNRLMRTLPKPKAEDERCEIKGKAIRVRQRDQARIAEVAALRSVEDGEKPILSADSGVGPRRQKIMRIEDFLERG